MQYKQRLENKKLQIEIKQLEQTVNFEKTKNNKNWLRLERILKIGGVLGTIVALYFNYIELAQPYLKQRIQKLTNQILEDSLTNNRLTLENYNLKIEKDSLKIEKKKLASQIFALQEYVDIYQYQLDINDSTLNEILEEYNNLSSIHYNYPVVFEQNDDEEICNPFREGYLDYSSFREIPNSELRRLPFIKNYENIEGYILKNPAIFSPISGTINIWNESETQQAITIENEKFILTIHGVSPNYTVRDKEPVSKCLLLAVATTDYNGVFSVGFTLYDKLNNQFISFNELLEKQ